MNGELSTSSASTYEERERANKRKNGIADSILSEKQNMKRRGEKKCLHKGCAAEKGRETIARTLVIADNGAYLRSVF